MSAIILKKIMRSLTFLGQKTRSSSFEAQKQKQENSTLIKLSPHALQIKFKSMY